MPSQRGQPRDVGILNGVAGCHVALWARSATTWGVIRRPSRLVGHRWPGLWSWDARRHSVPDGRSAPRRERGAGRSGSGADLWRCSHSWRRRIRTHSGGMPARPCMARLSAFSQSESLSAKGSSLPGRPGTLNFGATAPDERVLRIVFPDSPVGRDIARIETPCRKARRWITPNDAMAIAPYPASI